MLQIFILTDNLLQKHNGVFNTIGQYQVYAFLYLFLKLDQLLILLALLLLGIKMVRKPDEVLISFAGIILKLWD